MTHIKFLAIALLLAFGFSACRVTSSYSYTSKPDTFLIAESIDESGEKVEYRAVPGGRGGPAIHKVSTRKLEVAFVGITPRSLDQNAASKRGLDAWRGVLIEKIATNTPAKTAGLKTGDVILAIGDEAISNAEQCRELIETRLPPSGTVDVTYLRQSDEEWSEETVEMTIRPRVISEASTDRFPLEAPEEMTRRTGLEIVTVPIDLATDIWGDSGPSAIVTGVVVGSSGYRAGIRQGDRIRTCNGFPVESAEMLVGQLFGSPKGLQLTVDGPLGPHSATVDTRLGIDVERSTYIPILYDHESTVDRSATAVLNFIFQFGFTKRHRYLPSSTRAVAESSSLSILPLGLFEFSRSPTKSKNTIFWFITWSTRR